MNKEKLEYWRDFYGDLGNSEVPVRELIDGIDEEEIIKKTNVTPEELTYGLSEEADDYLWYLWNDRELAYPTEPEQKKVLKENTKYYETDM
tara:strand:+ start:407 stop:679 length:273 start_codon:yes stop_codon:yes gene_type:complete